MHAHSTLTAQLDRLASLITGRATTPPASIIPASDTLSALKAPPRPAQRPTEAPTPTVRPTLPTADEVRGSRRLSPGAYRLWLILHALARHVAQVNGHAVLPAALAFHLPAVIVAALVGYSERHTYRLADELRAAGLIDKRGHVAQVGKLRRYDGTLWAVSLKPDGPAPRLRWWDFQRVWRPDFASDYCSEKGAWRQVQAIMSEPFGSEGKAKLQALADAYLAGLKIEKNPVGDGSDMRPGRALQAVAHDLPALLNLHPRHRHREVSRLAADLAHALSEPGRHRQHCATIYAALNAENEQRPGLAALALQLQRLATDLAELAPWRKPGAVLASRLR